MGVREQVVEERPTYDSNTGAYTGTSTYERPYEEAPGISPLLVAEVLDHAIFFSLGGSGQSACRSTKKSRCRWRWTRTPTSSTTAPAPLLKDYLIQRRWEGDTTFRGRVPAMGDGLDQHALPSDGSHPQHQTSHHRREAPARRHPDSVLRRRPHLRQRAGAHRPAARRTGGRIVPVSSICVRRRPRTSSRASRASSASMSPALRPTSSRTRCRPNGARRSSRRQIAAGINVVICNPELVKTGLDLIHFPTLIFHEITFNLSAP